MRFRLVFSATALILLTAACTATADEATTTTQSRPARLDLIDATEPALETVPDDCGSVRGPCDAVHVWLDGRYEIGLVGFPDADLGEQTVATGVLDSAHLEQLRHLVDAWDIDAVAAAEAERRCPESLDAVSVPYTVATPTGQVTLHTCPGGDAEEPYITAENVIRSTLVAQHELVALRTAEFNATVLPYSVVRSGGRVLDGRVVSVADRRVTIDVRRVRHGPELGAADDRLVVRFAGSDDLDIDDAFETIAEGDRVVVLSSSEGDVVSVGQVENGDLVDVSSSDPTFGLGHIMHLALMNDIDSPAATSDCVAAGFGDGPSTAATALEQLDQLAAMARRDIDHDAARALARRRGRAKTATVEYVGKPDGVYILFVDRRGLLGFVGAGAGKSGSLEVATTRSRSKVGVWLVERVAVAPCKPYEIATAVADLGFEFVRIPRGELTPHRKIRVNLNKGIWREAS